MLGDELAGAHFAIAQFGMLMNIAPPLNDLRFDFFCEAIDILRRQRISRLQRACENDYSQKPTQVTKHGNSPHFSILKSNRCGTSFQSLSCTASDLANLPPFKGKESSTRATTHRPTGSVTHEAKANTDEYDIIQH